MSVFVTHLSKAKSGLNKIEELNEMVFDLAKQEFTSSGENKQIEAGSYAVFAKDFDRIKLEFTILNS